MQDQIEIDPVILQCGEFSPCEQATGLAQSHQHPISILGRWCIFQLRIECWSIIHLLNGIARAQAKLRSEHTTRVSIQATFAHLHLRTIGRLGNGPAHAGHLWLASAQTRACKMYKTRNQHRSRARHPAVLVNWTGYSERLRPRAKAAYHCFVQ